MHQVEALAIARHPRFATVQIQVVVCHPKMDKAAPAEPALSHMSLYTLLGWVSQRNILIGIWNYPFRFWFWNYLPCCP